MTASSRPTSLKGQHSLWQSAVAVLVVLFALAVSQALVVQKRLSILEKQSIGHTDSLELARAYAGLTVEIFDLQQELDLRNLGTIPLHRPDIQPPPGAPPGIRPVPSFTISSVSEADRSLARAILTSQTPNAERESLSSVYHGRDIEALGVDVRLRGLGIALRPSRPLHAQPTNAITFGDSVALEDVRLIAYALIEAGIEVTRMRRFETGGGKQRLIEISYIPYASEWPPLTVAQISRLTTAHSTR